MKLRIRNDLDTAVVVDKYLESTLEITLSSGKKLSIELFERSDGFITIRASDSLIVKPKAGNSVELG